MRLVLVSFVVGVLAACTQSPEQKAQDLCTAVCDCEETLPSKQTECVDKCVQTAPATISDDCINCIYTYSQSCGDLLPQCIDKCQQPTP